jgi:eukaryotic-like serine/threonine-protein kinase
MTEQGRPRAIELRTTTDITARGLRDYEITTLLGFGGHATVHLARSGGGGGPLVAIKRLRPHLADDVNQRDALRREARLAACARSEHVVAMLEVVEDGPTVAIVMEYVMGASLAEVLARSTSRPIPIPVAVAIVCDILQGLRAAHEACDESGEALAVVHGDVSPRNAIVSVDGVTRILDFGLARATAREPWTADRANLVGTFAYASPEHARGESIDCRSDLFGVGVLLWEALTGQQRFTGVGPVEILTDILYGEPRPAAHARPSVWPDLEAVVTRATARDREARFGSARDMKRALELACVPASRQQVATWLHRTMTNPA